MEVAPDFSFFRSKDRRRSGHQKILKGNVEWDYSGKLKVMYALWFEGKD